jgi:hypothetical protein
VVLLTFCAAPVGANDDTPGVRALQSLKEMVPEAMAAASLTISLLQIYPDEAVPLLEPSLRYVANPCMPRAVLPASSARGLVRCHMLPAVEEHISGQKNKPFFLEPDT